MELEGISGNKADVNKDHAVQVSAPSGIHQASLKGDVYAFNSVSYVPSAADTILCVANDSSERLLVISKIYLYSDVPTAVDVHFPAKATWTGTAVTGVNLNRAVDKAAPATAITDETGQATQGPIWITLHTNEVATDQFSIDYSTNDAIILGKDTAIGIDLVANAGEEECTIIGYYIDA